MMKKYLNILLILMLLGCSFQTPFEEKLQEMEDLVDDFKDKYDQLKDNSLEYAEYEENLHWSYAWFWADDELTEFDIQKYRQAILIGGKIKEYYDELQKIRTANNLDGFEDFYNHKYASSKLKLYYNYKKKNNDLTLLLERLNITIDKLEAEIAFVTSDEIIIKDSKELSRRLEKIKQNYDPSQFLYEDINYEPDKEELREIFDNTLNINRSDDLWE